MQSLHRININMMMRRCNEFIIIFISLCSYVDLIFLFTDKILSPVSFDGLLSIWVGEELAVLDSPLNICSLSSSYSLNNFSKCCKTTLVPFWTMCLGGFSNGLFERFRPVKWRSLPNWGGREIMRLPSKSRVRKYLHIKQISLQRVKFTRRHDSNNS